LNNLFIRSWISRSTFTYYR